MASTVQQLVDAVKQAGFDNTDTEILGWLNERWTDMHGYAKSYRSTVSLGPTVAGTAFYATPTIIEMFTLEVGEVPYGKARHADIYGYAEGAVVWTGPGGLAVEDASTAGVRGLTLIPTPEESGETITAYAAVLPADLSLDTAGNTLLTSHLDADFHRHLVAGAIGTGLLRAEGRADLAAPHEQQYMGAREEFRRRVQRRLRGAGPSQIRIAGINA